MGHAAKQIRVGGFGFGHKAWAEYIDSTRRAI